MIITIEAEQEHYCLVTNGGSWTVVERRAGKYYPLGDCSRPGVDLDKPEGAVLFRDGRSYPELVARNRLADVAARWRDLAEHMR
jgi:hypothetical protein